RGGGGPARRRGGRPCPDRRPRLVQRPRPHRRRLHDPAGGGELHPAVPGADLAGPEAGHPGDHRLVRVGVGRIRDGGDLRRPLLHPPGRRGERPGGRGQRVAGTAPGHGPADATGAGGRGGDPGGQRAEGLRPGAGTGAGVRAGRRQRAEPGDVPRHVHEAQRRVGQRPRGAVVRPGAARDGMAGTGATTAGGVATVTFVRTTVPELRPAGTMPSGPPPPSLASRLASRLGGVTVRVVVLAATLVWLSLTLGLAVTRLSTSEDNSANWWCTSMGHALT